MIPVKHRFVSVVRKKSGKASLWLIIVSVAIVAAIAGGFLIKTPSGESIFIRAINTIFHGRQSRVIRKADLAYHNRFKTLKAEYDDISSKYDTLSKDESLDADQKTEQLNQLFNSCFDLSSKLDDFHSEIVKLKADDLTPADVKDMQDKTINLSKRIKDSLK